VPPSRFFVFVLRLLRVRWLMRLLYPDQLFSGYYLLPGDSLVSNNRINAFVFQNDGNVVVIRGGIHKAWSTKTAGQGGARLTMLEDGNCLLIDASATLLWKSNTAGHPNSRLVMQDDGNLVIYDANGVALWATSTELKLQLIDSGTSVGVVGQSFAPGGDATITYTFLRASEQPNPQPFPTPIAVPVDAGGAIGTEIAFDRNDTAIQIIAQDRTGLSVSRRTR
jgi:hypothetical protein